MNIVTFCQMDESLFNSEFKVEYFHTTGEASDADIVIIDIDSIFEFEENKSKVTKELVGEKLDDIVDNVDITRYIL